MEKKYKFTCPHCGAHFEGGASLDNLGWHTSCPDCGESFDVDVFDKRYVVAIAKMPDECYDKYFVDDVDFDGIEEMYTFETPEELLDKVRELIEDPPSMWYWVLDTYTENCVDEILGGAIDPNDTEIIEEYFGLERDDEKDYY